MKKNANDIGRVGKALSSFFDSLADQIWKTLVSVRLTILLLILLTAFSIAGTLIAQQGTTQVPIEKLYSLTTLKWLHAFGFTDIYHSAFFVFLIFTLALNLISCSIERLPKVWREAFKEPHPSVESSVFESSTPELARKRKFLTRSLEIPAKQFSSINEAKMASMLFLQEHFGNKKYSLVHDSEDQFQICVEKGKYSRLGVYITHLSLLLIMFGASLGSILGFEGVMNVEEGTKISWITHLKGSSSGLLLMRENGLPVPGFLNLGFEVECEKFTLETYPDDRPKSFRSVLHFYENDVRVHSAEISVNHPTVYKGMTFYQASFNKAGIGGADLKVFRVASSSKEERNPSAEKENKSAPSLVQDQMPKIDSVERVENVHENDLYRIDGDAAFRISDLQEDLMQMGPALKVQYFRTKATKTPESFWIFKNLPGFDFAHRKGTKIHFVLEDLKPKYATGLSVARDPGVWVVWIGSLILILALFLALYTYHCRYWVVFTKENGFCLVGWSNKLFLFEPKYEKFFEVFSQNFKDSRKEIKKS